MPPKKSPANQALGEAIRPARQERKLAQEACATQTGIDRSYFGAIERGEFNVTLDTITKIATALDIRISQLLARAGL
jgi:transcriptional regulator with XRE-family HTH domain